MEEARYKKPPFELKRTMRGGLAEQLAAEFRRAIDTGYYRPGDMLPPVREQTALLKVSRVVVVRAMAMLAEERLVHPRPHYGCEVCSSEKPLWKGQVLIVVPPSGTQHYMNVICAKVREALIAAGYLALTVTVSRADDGEYDFAMLDLMMRQHTDLVVQLHDKPEIARWLSLRKTPFVRLTVDAGSSLPRGCIGAVRISSERAVVELAVHCRELGVKEVLVATARGYLHVKETLCAAGVNARYWEIGMPPGTPGPQVSQHALDAMAERLAEKRPLPELIFFDDDYIASGAIVAMLYAGVRIPQDVRIAALTHRSSGSGLAFPVLLTRIEVDSAADGRAAAAAVLEYLKTGTFPSGVTVGAKYVRGETL